MIFGRLALIFLLIGTTYASNINDYHNKLSPFAAKLKILLESSDTTDLDDQFHTIFLNGERHFGALIKVDPTHRSELGSLDVIHNDFPGNIIPVKIPQSKYLDLFRSPFYEYIQLDISVSFDLDKVLSESKIDKVYQGLSDLPSLTGKNVIIGIIDYGFDFEHETFKDQNNSLRIISAWNQLDNRNRRRPAGFNYGVEYIGSELINEEYDLEASHGSHVTGIAAGKGDIAGRYRGVAPEADIIMVTPLVDDQSLITTGLSDILNGIYYIFKKADDLGKAAVVNMSLGAHIGPHDGTALFDEACDNIVGPGKCIVTSAGNSGAESFSAILDPSQETHYLAFSPITSTRPLYIDIWGEEGSDICIQMGIKGEFDDLTICSRTPGIRNGSFYYSGVNIDYQVSVSNRTFNKRPRVFIEFETNDSDPITLKISSDDKVYVWDAAVGGSTSGSIIRNYRSNYTDPLEYYQIGEIGGNSRSIITVGSYNIRKSIRNYFGSTISGITDDIYDISEFSSKGPTIDERQKPNISAPGEMVVSAFNFHDSQIYESYEYNSDLIHVRDNRTRYEIYGVAYGTSMSSPVVAGAIALMFELNPNLTPEDIDQILRSSAKRDSFTNGNRDEDDIWGAGKLDVEEAVKLAATYDPNNEISVFTYPNPSSSIFNILTEDNEEELSFEIINLYGEHIDPVSINSETLIDHTIDLSNGSNGVYFVIIKSSSDQKIIKIIKD